MKGKTALILASLSGITAVTAASIYKIIPCTKTPNVPNPEVIKTLCTIKTTNTLDTTIKYFWGTTNTAAYLITFIIPAVITLILIWQMTRERRR